jgi:SAM-dependent methyltransferase
MADEAVTPATFRARAATELAGIEHFAGWLDAVLAPESRARLAGDTRPWTPAGREWAGFSETFCRVLGWYKLEQVRRFADLGWTLRPEAVDRVADALTELIRGVQSAPDLPDDRRRWLTGYDVQPLARYTAADDRFQTLTGQPIRTVLDFGSGIGRQAFLWSHGRRDVRLYSVDAIESMYLVQAEMYQRLFAGRVIEYFTVPDFPAALAGAPPDAVVHLPTWRLAAIPSASVDLAICVQILQELPESLVRHLVAEFRRIVRPGGLLYIRDKEFWTPTHKLRVGRSLLADGWRLVFRYTGDEGTEIEGTPRLWVNAGEDTSRYFRPAARLKRMLLPSYPRSYGSWRDVGLPI